MPQHCADEDNMDAMSDFSEVLEESRQVIRQCFKEFKLEEVFLSFNGGKDCTLLLDVTLDVLRDLHHRHMTENLKVLCIQTTSPFRELDEFMKQVESHYKVKLTMMQGGLKEALGDILNNDKRLKACLMGTRRTDPYSENLEFMQNTDGDWPKLLRVSPLLNWNYHQIWSYIRKKKVPYCSLYDIGYTSIGSTSNTRPNPHLALRTACGRLSYLPAWKLKDGALERAGRGQPNAAYSNGNEKITCSHLCTSNGDVA